MFCSNCGKTLIFGEDRCRHCGAPVGESRFEGVPYTSAQAKILPGGSPYEVGRAYTRTTYSGMNAEAGATDERTTYRPVYEGASVPEEIRDDVRAAVNGGEEAPDRIPVTEDVAEAVDKLVEEEFSGAEEELKNPGFDMSDLTPRPIESRGQSGISPEVSEYVQKLEAERERKAEKRQARSGGSEQTGLVVGASTQDVFSENYDDEAEEDEIEERTRLSSRAMQLLKILGALVVLAAIIVGIIFWVKHVSNRSQGSPIEGVSLDLYDAGIEMISSHADENYVSSLLSRYTNDGILSLTQQLEADATAVNSLTAAEPKTYDTQFVSALRSIQSNIGNAVTMDALALAQPTEDSATTSATRWQVINDSITQLKGATTPQQLDAIINGERIVIQTVAPTMTPTPVTYATLTRGDKSEDVRLMQERLFELGFLQDVRDGNFGGNTYTAVKAFQQAVGIDVTGIADSKTLTLLYSDDAPSTQFAQPAATPATNQ